MDKRGVPLIGLALAILLLASTLWAQPPANAPSQGEDPAPGGGVTLPSGFVIGNDDVLSVHVWKEPDVSRSLSVRSDGRISLPLVGEIQAAGRTPVQLEAEIADRLKKYITDPQVAVIVQTINSEKFNILGQVARPGAYSLTQVTTVLDAIACAGGFRDFAKQKAIYILRQKPGGGDARIPFNYKEVIKGIKPEQNIRLEPRDTVVVP